MGKTLDLGVLAALMQQKTILQNRISSDTKELKRVERAILVLDPPEGNKWTEQAIGCLESNGCLQKTAEILECIYYGKEEILKNAGRRRVLLASLSNTLNKLCDEGILCKKVVPGEKGHLYGLREWFKEDGSLKNKLYERKRNQ